MPTKYGLERLLDPEVDSLEFPFEDAVKIRVYISQWSKRNNKKLVTHQRDRPQGKVLEVTLIGDRNTD